MRSLNFSAGPAQLPLPVLLQLRDELLDWRGTGASVAELSHRGKPFMALAEEIEADARALLEVPDSHAVLFLSGGATTQQALIPMNLCAPGEVADYLVTGHWSKVAIKQAAAICSVNEVASAEGHAFTRLPPVSEWRRHPDAAYFHVTGNETIHGVEVFDLPESDGTPVVADLSSNIASRPMDFSKIGLAYAGAQKNLGPSGITLTVVDRALLAREGMPRPDIFKFASHAAQGSMLNTPPTLNWYVLGLCIRWMLNEGGTRTFEQSNLEKSAALYSTIDQSSGFYTNPIEASCRSRMNVPFVLHDSALDAVFLEESERANMIGLKGHKAVGGMRASLYNAIPLADVHALCDFMQEFQRRHG
ncbi:phosphoserine transaminase [Lysobacter sp. HDW10]|uniref:phosphoserine transaminase n=1 Tax=Lysobacter sp. HDW10 TaxID=2714936 RepID=UPI00140CC9AE|nr:phosphoserine transaminase [Lysobacter sp. HDW10]QIK81521.1 phosphoserine transaminase [Lysobacter sp. HDW10]